MGDRGVSAGQAIGGSTQWRESFEEVLGHMV